MKATEFIWFAPIGHLLRWLNIAEHVEHTTARHIEPMQQWASTYVWVTKNSRPNLHQLAINRTELIQLENQLNSANEIASTASTREHLTQVASILAN